MSRLKVKDTCRICGFSITHEGDDIVQMLRQMDGAHDALRPECPEAVKRAALARAA